MRSDVTLHHGDCLQVMQSIADGSVDCVIADLPYGTTRNKWDSVLPLDQLWAAWKRVCRPGAPIIMFTQQPFTTTVAASNLKELRTEWIWEKHCPTGHLNAKRFPLKVHESLLVFSDRQPPYFPQMTTGAKPYVVKRKHLDSPNYGTQTPVDTINSGTRYPTTILRFPTDRPKIHPTQKPVALLEYLIHTYTEPGAMILDSTMGSGSTGVAALNTGRSFIGIEQDQVYFDIASERITSERPAPAATKTAA